MARSEIREKTIGNLVHLLKAHREKKGLSLNEVATRAGLSHTMVMRVEKGARIPTIDTLLRIAEAMEFDLPRALKKAITEATKPRS